EPGTRNPELLFLRSNIVLRKFLQMRRVQEADLLRVLERRVPGPVVAQYSPDQPEPADANCRRAMNEERPVRRVVRDFEELVGLFELRVAIDDGNVEVFQAGRLDGLLLIVDRVFLSRAEVE